MGSVFLTFFFYSDFIFNLFILTNRLDLRSKTLSKRLAEKYATCQEQDKYRYPRYARTRGNNKASKWLM